MKTTSTRAGLLALSALLAAGCSEDAAVIDYSTLPTHTVTRGPLEIRVREAGELDAASKTLLRSPIDRRATINYLIPEGTQVEEGDKLIELDVSNLIERRAEEEIDLEKAKANLVAAKLNLKIQLKEIAAAEQTAESSLQIAEMELEKFLGRIPAAGTTLDPNKGSNMDMLSSLEQMVTGGDLEPLLGVVRDDLLIERNLFDESGEPHATSYLQAELGECGQKILEQIDQILLFDSDLSIKKDTFEQSKRLHEQTYVTRNELERDEYAYISQLSRTEIGRNELDLLINYTLKKTKIELVQKVSNAQLELDRVRAQNLARKAREEAEYKQFEAEVKLEEEYFNRLVWQIDHATILAPTDGFVVYASQGSGYRRETVEEGSRVYRRQALIELPDISSMVVKVRVQEADVNKVVPGQRCKILLDAYGDEPLWGAVDKVAPLPDSRSRYENTQLKVYMTTVSIDGDTSRLRPGMGAMVEILVGDIPEALTVPFEAVAVDGAVDYVWVATANGPMARQVKIGASSLTRIQILEGLQPGDRIYLQHPPGVEDPHFAQPETLQPATDEQIEASRRELEAAGQADARAAMKQIGEELIGILKKRFPDRADELSDTGSAMRLMFTDEAIRGAMQEDPVLQQLMTEFREAAGSMGGMFGGRPGGGGGRPSGRPGGGDERGGTGRGGSSRGRGGPPSGRGGPPSGRGGERGPGGGDDAGAPPATQPKVETPAPAETTPPQSGAGGAGADASQHEDHE